jgi:membrane protein
MNRRELFNIFKTSFLDWLEDNASLRAAALTFFIILPLPSLLLIVVAFFALFFGQTQAINIIVLQISTVVGPAVADLFGQILANATSPFTSVWTAIVVLGFSFGAAIGTFSVLRDTMDCIWEVEMAKGQSLLKRVRQKTVPFAVVSALGLIVIAWTAVARGLFNAITTYIPNSMLAFITLNVAQILLSFIIATVLLAIIYKMIPETKVHWQDVGLAALVTGVAFTVTNYIFGTYVQTFTVTTVIGAAGSLMVLLLWIYILNLIVLFGAELSKVYATTVGFHGNLYRVNLPEPLKKAVEVIEMAGARLEDASKEETVPSKPQSAGEEHEAKTEEDKSKARVKTQKHEG